MASVGMRLSTGAGLLVLVLFGLSAHLPAEDKKPRRSRGAELVKKLKAAVVTIHGTREKPKEKEEPTESGVGVIIDPKGIVVMPRRLLDGISKLEVVLGDGRKLTPKTATVDRKAEIAILTLTGDKPFPSVELGDVPAVGEWAVSLGLVRVEKGEEPLDVESGTFAGMGRPAGREDDLLEFDSARCVSPRRDLVFDMEGRLIGVWTRGGAVPSERVKDALERMPKSR